MYVYVIYTHTHTYTYVCTHIHIYNGILCIYTTGIYTMEYYSAIKKNESLSFITI